MERESWGRGSERGLAGRWPVLGTSPQCSVPPLGLGAWEKLVLLWLQLSGGKLSPFPENPNNMYLQRLLGLDLTMGGYV